MSLANDAIRTVIQKSIEQPGTTAVPVDGQSCGDGSVLPDQNACLPREEGAQKQNQGIEVRHAGKDEVRLEPVNEAQQLESCQAHPRRVEGVDDDALREMIGFRAVLSDERQVQHIFFARKASRKLRRHLFRAAATKMRDQ